MQKYNRAELIIFFIEYNIYLINNMFSLISCGIINKNIIYILIGGMGKILAQLIYKVDNEIKNHPFYLGIASGLGMSLSLIPFIFVKKKSRNVILNEQKDKSYNKDTNSISSKNNNKKNQYKRKITFQKYLLIFISAILDFSQKLLSFVFIDNIDYNFWIFDMIFLSLFSFCILKTRLYKHQYLTLGIMIILGIAFNIINLYNVADKNRYKNVLLVLLIEIIFSLCTVINKYLMEYRFCLPYEISFYQGIISLIINIILLSIFTNIEIDNINYQNIEYNGKKYLDNFYQYIEQIKLIRILVFIVTMICRLTFNLFSIITVKYYTPSHIALILLIGEIAFIFDNGVNLKLYIKMIIILILTFSLLIFTEIIELNFCGLQKYTRKNIAERADSASGKSDDSNEVDGLEIKSNGSSNDSNDINDNKNEKDCTKQLLPDKEMELFYK